MKCLILGRNISELDYLFSTDLFALGKNGIGREKKSVIASVKVMVRDRVNVYGLDYGTGSGKC